MIGRVEEWWKSVCINHKCKYYDHRDYPYCSICTCPDNCIVVDKQKESEEKNESK